MRAVSLHADVIVVTSRVWQTTCTVVRGPDSGRAAASPQALEHGASDEAFVIDSPVFPDELEILPALLEQAGFPLAGLLVTHADWDHLLAGLAFPETALGGAPTTAQRLAAEPGGAARELREFDDEHYVVRPRPLSLGALQVLPVPGRCELGSGELELHPSAGHTADGMVVWIPWAAVLVVGDYLSPVEIPAIESGGSLTEYLATLERLGPLVRAAEHVVPGHGHVLDSAQAIEILQADTRYLQELREQGAAAALPRAARSPTQRRRHAENVARVASRA
jgi:glyoxylase-like metal-dependent hydrolase (beta-lactamase superfamily II)